MAPPAAWRLDPLSRKGPRIPTHQRPSGSEADLISRHRQFERIEPHRHADADLHGAELDDRIAVDGADIAQEDLIADIRRASFGAEGAGGCSTANSCTEAGTV